MKQMMLFHDGCSLCLSISDIMLNIVDTNTYNFESFNLGEDSSMSQTAKEFGVKRLPSLVIEGKVLRVDDHSPIEDYLN